LRRFIMANNGIMWTQIVWAGKARIPPGNYEPQFPLALAG